MSDRNMFSEQQNEVISENNFNQIVKTERFVDPKISYIVKSNLMMSARLPEMFDITPLCKQ